MEISKLLKQRRADKGLTMKQVADKVGVAESTYSRWENGAIANMTREKIKLLADALDVNPAELIGEPVAEIQNELHGKQKILFDLTRNASEEDMDKFIQMIKLMKGE